MPPRRAQDGGEPAGSGSIDPGREPNLRSDRGEVAGSESGPRRSADRAKPLSCARSEVIRRIPARWWPATDPPSRAAAATGSPSRAAADGMGNRDPPGRGPEPGADRGKTRLAPAQVRPEPPRNRDIPTFDPLRTLCDTPAALAGKAHRGRWATSRMRGGETRARGGESRIGRSPSG
jgi:hypothetical protein